MLDKVFKQGKENGLITPQVQSRLTHHHSTLPCKGYGVFVFQCNVHAGNFFARGAVHLDALCLELHIAPDMITMMVSVQNMCQSPPSPFQFTLVRSSTGSVDCCSLTGRGIVDQISGAG